jgi:hypothetical protein
LITSKKDALFDQLLSCLERGFPGDAGNPVSLAAWATDTPVILDGRAFAFARHEYLDAPYRDDHPFVVEMKAAQLGLTTKAMLQAVYGCRYGGYRGVLYLFPSKTDVTDFSKGRVSPLIDDNQETIGKWLKDTDSANIKRIGNAFLYLRGMRSRVGLKSIPVDFIVFDELDEGNQNAIDMAMERMGHSEYRRVLMLSNPTLPDFGIDKAFQETDQRYWLLKCPACGEWTCLEDTFPDCLVEVDGRVIRACQRCRGELDPSIGEWVAKRPDVVDKRGYHYSQLFSHYVDPGDILRQFRTTTNLTDFYNLKLGVAYVEASHRLSIQEVLNCCGMDGIAAGDHGPCYMGVDQGQPHHVVISRRHAEKASQVIYLGVHRGWEEMDPLMRDFQVARCVVDALPETWNARAFADRHRGRVFLNYYSEHQKGSYAWNEKELTVSCNRTESLDASHREILEARVILPRESDLVRTFAEHCRNTAKRLEEDPETGSQRYVYVKLGPDHFRHAWNYACMAIQYGRDAFLPGYDLSRLVVRP